MFKKSCVYIRSKNGIISSDNENYINQIQKLTKKINIELDLIITYDKKIDKVSSRSLNKINKIFFIDCKCYMNFNILMESELIEQIIKKNHYEVLFLKQNLKNIELSNYINYKIKSNLFNNCTEISNLKNGIYKIKNSYKNIKFSNIIKESNSLQIILMDFKDKNIYKQDLISIKNIKNKIFEINTEETINKYKNNIKTKKIITKNNSCNLNTQESKIVLGIGRGVNNIKTFNKIKQIANCLDAKIVATMGAIENNIDSKLKMIGISGIKIKPQLYITFGISGSIHHMAGIDTKNCKIISINIDENAPIFSISQHKIIDKIENVVDKIIKILKNE